jgi:hypothetical protein
MSMICFLLATMRDIQKTSIMNSQRLSSEVDLIHYTARQYTDLICQMDRRVYVWW